MTLLTAAEITGMRETASQALAGTAVIQRKQRISDGGGGGTTSFVAHGTVDARLAPISVPRDAEPMSGGKITPDADWLITMPAGTDVGYEDRVLISDKTLEVAAVSERTQEITTMVTANEVS